MIKTTENAKFFNAVGKKFAKGAIEAGFEKLPSVKTLGSLAGKYVPEPIAFLLKSEFKPVMAFEKVTKPIMATFKFGKVVLNPATHVRNIISNYLLNSLAPLNIFTFKFF